MNQVRSLLSMRCMLLGLFRTHSLIIGVRLVQQFRLWPSVYQWTNARIRKKPDWREKTGSTSPEVLAAVASKAWRDSGRTLFSPTYSKTLLEGQPHTQTSSRYSSYRRRLGTNPIQFMKYISACFVIDLRDNLFTKVTQLSFGVILVLLLITPGGGGRKKIYLASSQTTPAS